MQFANVLPVQEARKLFRSHPFYLHIATIFILLVLAIQLGMGLYTRHQTKKMVAESLETTFEHVQRELLLQAGLLGAPIELLVEVAGHSNALMRAANYAERIERSRVLVAALESQQQIAAFHIAYENGEFFLVRPLRDQAARDRFKVPPESRFLVQSVEDGGARTRWVALDENLAPLREWSPADYHYDPRTRSWYRQAIQTSKLIRSEPYVLATTGVLGRTVAMRSEDGKAVAGADVNIETLSTALQRNRMTASAELAIFDPQGGAIAYSDPARVVTRDAQGKPALAKLRDLSPLMAAVAADRTGFSQTRRITSGGREWSLKVMPLPTALSKDLLVIAAPVDELDAEVRAIEYRLMAVTLLVIALTVPVIFFVARQIASQLNILTQQAAAIRRFDFRTEIPLKTRVREIFGLGRAMRQMRETISKFLEVSIALSAERDFEKLLERVLHEVREAADGDGGVIYLYDEDQHLLRHSLQRWASGGKDVAESHADLSIGEESHPVVAATRNMQEPSAHLVAHPRPKGLEYLDARYGTAAVETVVVPLLGRTGNLVGVLCNFMSPGKSVPSPERMALVSAFASAAAVSIDQQRLLLAQKALLDAFIGLVAGAIDAKSPYTGGHCQRVPELTQMIARAAHESKEGPFASFRLADEDWEALRIAAWLHDCGKVTTPEYVVDKATKLETLYDRIHEVRMRFEVLKRDAEIAMLRKIAAGGDPAALDAALQDELRAIDSDYQFIAACNEGGEFMSPDKIERLKRVALRTWQRTLDNRIGVSWEERARMERSPAVPLPAIEPVLADRPEHVIERGPRDLMPADNPWGFQLKVPGHLYNRGELYNLAIGRGTLTEEERYKINDHIVQTIIMLSKLPFPRNLKAVPELAGGHHEKMDGNGYPKRLKRDEMSVQARIMAIADIFEALTAMDRPYKRGKKLSEAIKIMSFMVKEAHIDPDLFRLFLDSGVYRHYAEKYMPAEFIDEVDLGQYLKAA